MEPGRERVYVRRRKGFVKLALRYGYTIYPIYTFGESHTYRIVSRFSKGSPLLR